MIAVPIRDRGLSINGKQMVVCFMEIDMNVMLQGVSMKSQNSESTFCNIYTDQGIALSNTVLGGLAVEDNLLEALSNAKYEEGYSYDQVVRDFSEGNKGVVSFTYDGIQETISYIPVRGTNWLLTYLIRESVISERIGALSNGILRRSLLQSVLTALVLGLMFAFLVSQIRRNARLALEKEKTETENRIKHQELEQRLLLQEQLLKQKAEHEQQEKMITALASDYRSVYYLELDNNKGICYQSRSDLDGLHVGESFDYLEAVTAYCNRYILEPYREEFLRFIQPDNIRQSLKESRVISYRYRISVDGRESYEAVRFAGVRHPEDREDHLVHSVGACFADVDGETRKEIEQRQALNEALADAEQASRAKTAFLSNMSHEIRTPMNAIIGLNNIALNEPDVPDKVREYLVKTGDAAQHLLGIINDILDMSRIESGRMVIKNEEFSFVKNLEQVNTIISGQCRDKGLHYDCRTIGRIDDYYIGDGVKLRQVMINILGNAVKFTPEGGTVTFLIEEGPRFERKAVLKFTIRDTGIGMSQEYLPHLFDAFSQEDSSSTNRFGSTGLGMPITKSIVELMNGYIDVESEKGVGTTFTVTVTLGESARNSELVQEGEINPHEMSVLAIDDDRIALEHAQIVLGQIGISCEVASSGEEGLEMVKMRHARRADYNLILVDWKMPGMDGVETTRQIRAVLGNETPIIILTSYNWDEVADEALAAGVDTFVPKPLFANSVLDEFRSAFRQKNEAMASGCADLKGRRVLLAEDMAVNAEIMVMVLSMREIEAELAENGRIAVEKFTSHPAGYYDAILMDMRMPEMDGLEATRAIRASGREDAGTIPIIALTANAFDEDVQRSMQAGLNAHLSKPVEPEALFETLESLIRP
ncbi:MAG: response regulator [Lachnospiraceae bacterium]|nr:response regulator [Lachnospiraceae bacterium]